jgi:hypothetical protein
MINIMFYAKSHIRLFINILRDEQGTIEVLKSSDSAHSCSNEDKKTCRQHNLLNLKPKWGAKRQVILRVKGKSRRNCPL